MKEIMKKMQVELEETRTEMTDESRRLKRERTDF